MTYVQGVEVDDRPPEEVVVLVEVPHTDLSKVSQVVPARERRQSMSGSCREQAIKRVDSGALVEVCPVVVLSTGLFNAKAGRNMSAVDPAQI